MIKHRISALIVLIYLFMASLYAGQMVVDFDSSPTSIALKWDRIGEALYYDIYKDNEFVARVDSSQHSYEIDNLYCSTSYNISIAARDGENNTISAAWLDVVTDTWDGIYTWTNLTKNDNKGKLKKLTVRVEMKIDPKYGQYPEIWFQNNDGSESRIFPLFDFDDPESNKWHKYKEESVAGRAYRENASRFNITSFNPGKWKLARLVIDSNETTSYILTSILSFELTTWSKFVFFEEADSVKRLSLETVGEEAIVNSFIFKNPNPGEDGRFILTREN